MDRVLRAILRTDLRFFTRKVFATVSPGETYLHNWHVDAITHQLMRVHLGEVLRLLINQPPRSLKSICVSVAYVAWLLGHDPTRRVIVVSYSGDFAAELHRQFRMVVSSEWYAALFPTLRHDSRRKPIRDLSWRDAHWARRRSDHRRRSPQRQRGPIGAGQEARNRLVRRRTRLASQ
jgi:hypothetical protein